MQTQGLLQESSLASLLQTMQTERATGALALESQNESASLFFLFGHLFHAAGPAGQGEDVVLDALTWHDGSFHFDPRAKLPPEETIKASPSELIAEAERRGPAPAAGAPDSPGGWGPAAGYEDAGAYAAPAYAAPTYEEPVGGYAENGWAAAGDQELVGGDPQAAGYAPWSPPAPEPAAPAYQAPPRYPPVEQRPAPATVPYRPEPPAPPVRTPYRPEPPPAPTPAPAPEPEPAPAPQAVFGAPAAPPLDILYPLPGGRPQYEGLKSAFVDFPKLLRTLRGDQHTGYVRLVAPDFSGVLLYHQGHLLDARSTTPAARTGELAFQAMRRSMEAGAGSLDVIDLAGETVEAVAQLLTSPLLFTGLLGHFVNFDALLAYLTEEGVEGAVLVVGGTDIGVILLTRGRVLGAYTQNHPLLSTSTTAVAKIAGDKAARIEVKSGAGALSEIDVESALSRSY